MDIRDIRRQNLDKLIGNPGKRGRIIDFAQNYNFDPTYISQILNGYKKLGEKSARKMEAAMRLPEGYFDIYPGENTSPVSADESAVLSAYRAMPPDLKFAFRQYLDALQKNR